MGSEAGRYKNPAIYRWPYTRFADACHYITDDKPNDDGNKHRIWLTSQQRGFEYTENTLLKLVSGLGASFEAVEILPKLGGYRTFHMNPFRSGPDAYYYGDEFRPTPAMIARREAVRQWVHDLETLERKGDREKGGHKFVHAPGMKDYPNFSLWVGEKDPGLLHLLRRFNGQNKHWSIRTDTGDALEDCLATKQESKLGRYGC